MTGPALLFTIALVIAQFTVPKKWAFVPLLVAAVHTSHIANIAEFTTARMVIVAGILRAYFTGGYSFRPQHTIDKLMLLLGVFLLISSVGHDPIYGNPLKYRTGLTLNLLGAYFYGRAFIGSLDDFYNFCRASVLTLVPLAFLLSLEAASGINSYTIVGARLTESVERLGSIRAAGPFGTPILAGTVGAINLGACVILWQSNRRLAIIGFACCLAIMFYSHSSTPLGAAAILIGALCMWKYRHKARRYFWGGIALLTVLHFIKERPIWYLIALVDLVGGSTGWHRSKLIDQAVAHFGDWWLWGTDYTADWMPYRLPGVPNHCDLTNYFIHLGVIAGLPVVLILISIIYVALRDTIRASQRGNSFYHFMMWCSTAVLTTHAVTFLTISYYDQIYVFFYLLVAAVPALTAWNTSTSTEDNGALENEIFADDHRYGSAH